MASLVLGVAGAVVGSYFGMPSLGFAIGSALGGAIDPAKTPTQYGPRLTDLKVVSSNYGEMVPIVYGTMRIAGKMIWSTPRIEHRHKKKVGGKGGPSQKTVTYSYTQSIAYLLCEGTITGVTRIWINGELKYNVSAAAAVSTALASFASSDGIQIYFGDETQTPNSLIQSYEGAASTPAYRGSAYVVFNNLDVSNLSNAFNVEFEVVKTGTYNDYSSVMAAVPLQPTIQFNKVANYIPSPNKVRVIAGDWDTGYASSNVWLYDLYPDGSSVKVSTQAYALPASGHSGLGYGNANITSTVIIPGLSSSLGYLLVYDPTYLGSSSTIVDPWVLTTFYFDSTFSSAGIGALNTYYLEDNLLLVGIISATTGTNCIYATNPKGVGVAANVIDVSGSGHVIQSIDCSDSFIYVCYYDGTHLKVKKYNKTTYAYVSDLITLSGTAASVGLIKVYSDSEIYIWKNVDNDICEISTGTSIQKFAISIAPNQSSDLSALAVFDGTAITYSVYSGAKSVIFHSRPLTSDAVLLSDVVSDLCTTAGLTAGDIDVTQLTDNVYGYVIANVGSARSAIEPLMQCYYFDATEIDNKVVFVKRGQNSIVTIPEDDLAAHEYGSEIPDQIYATRQQELELPLQVNVSYLDKDNAYQVGSQYSRRLTTNSKQIVDVQLPLSISATKGKEVSDVLMYDAWAEREKIKLSLSNKYSYLVPTDVVTTSKGNISYTLRLTNKNEANGIISFDAVAETIAVYTQTQTAAPMPTVPDTVDLNGDTKCLLLDIPLLRDQDDGVGFYAAASGYDSGWSGADLLKSSDNNTYSIYGDGFFNAATIGYTNGVLGNWTGGNIFDESNTVSVTLYGGTLASDTTLNVLNGANVILIGSEIIQFKNATLTATLTYTLSGLLRGRQGTDWAQSTHATGEKVVELDASSIYLLSASSAEYNLARYYKAVTFGQNIIDADPFAFTNTGIAKKCYAPVQLGYGRDVSNNITLNWIRRTRIGGAWLDNTDASLGETSASYSIDILNGTTVVRTLTATTNTVSYTAAQVITDFGVSGSGFNANVYQVGANGRGYVASITVPSAAATVSLLHFNGTNASTTFTDQTGRIWTPHGNIQLSTAQAKFGTAAGLSDGTTDWISTPSSSDIQVGNRSFCVEFFIYFNTLPTAGVYATCAQKGRVPDSNFEFGISILNTGGVYTINWQSGTTGANFTELNSSSIAITTGGWHHIAACRDGNTIRYWYDGVSAGTSASATTYFAGTGVLSLFANLVGASCINGYMDEFRMTLNSPVYIAAFTPPTSEFNYP